MTRPAEAARLRADALRRLRLFDRRHPQWWVAAVAAAAWVAVVVRAWTEPPHHHGGGWGATTASLALMTAAMMLPLVLASSRGVAVSSRWRRRHRAQAAFLAGYLGVWVPVGLAVGLLVSAGASVLGGLVVLVLVATGSILYQFTLRKRRVLRWCAARRVPGGDGLRADLACARLGAGVAVPCVSTCGGLMAVAAAAGHGPVVMLALTAVAFRERTTREYDPRPGAAVIAGVMVLVVLVGPW